MDNDNFIEAKILYSLARKRKWGESHTAYENLFKTLKSETLGRKVEKKVRKLADGLIKKGLIIRKPTHYGLQVSLNPEMAQEIKKKIKEQLGFNI